MNILTAGITGTITGCPGIAKHANGLTGIFTSMVGDLASGNAESVIRYINRGSIRADVESILGYALTPEQAIIAGRQAPAHIDDLVLSRACTIARELQALRATGRRTCQMYQAHGAGSGELHSRLTAFLRNALDLANTWQEYEDVEGSFETW